MLSKPTGNTGLYALTTSTGTVNVTTLLSGPDYTSAKLPATKVRVAVTQPAVINFGTNVADNNSDLLLPANSVEHFTLQATNTLSYVLLTGATAGYISITPVA
jgi:hypothetical protein